jgi:predicted nucleotidyltransferase
VLADLREAAAEARTRHPEIVRVYLFGSLVRGDWTAASDADLIVVVRREFRDVLERSVYQIQCRAIPTDTLVCSEAEFERQAGDAGSFLAQALENAVAL